MCLESMSVVGTNRENNMHQQWEWTWDRSDDTTNPIKVVAAMWGYTMPRGNQPQLEERLSDDLYWIGYNHKQ